MYKVKLSKAELKELNRLKKKETNKKIFRRLQCLQLRNEGKSNQEIADITGACKDTVMDWIKIYNNEGLSGLRKLKYDGRRECVIDSHLDKIKQDLKENIFSTLAELQDWLKDKYNIDIGQSWLSKCCKKNSIILTKKHI